MLNDIKNVQDSVTSILTEYEETRDSDKKLWLAHCCMQRGLKDILGDKYPSFREWMLDPKTPVFESLSRARRKAQEENPSLEGKKKLRLKEAEEVREYMR